MWLVGKAARLYRPPPLRAVWLEIRSLYFEYFPQFAPRNATLLNGVSATPLATADKTFVMVSPSGRGVLCSRHLGCSLRNPPAFQIYEDRGENMRIRTSLLTLAVLFAAATVCFAADDPNMGSWKLNEAKSKFGAGAPKNTSVVYEAAGDSVKVTVEGVSSDGKSTHTEWTGKFDGKDYP